MKHRVGNLPPWSDFIDKVTPAPIRLTHKHLHDLYSTENLSDGHIFNNESTTPPGPLEEDDGSPRQLKRLEFPLMSTTMRAEDFDLAEWQNSLIDKMKAVFLEDGNLDSVLHAVGREGDNVRIITMGLGGLYEEGVSDTAKLTFAHTVIKPLLNNLTCSCYIHAAEAYVLFVDDLEGGQPYDEASDLLGTYGSVSKVPGAKEGLMFYVETRFGASSMFVEIERDEDGVSLAEDEKTQRHAPHAVVAMGPLCGLLAPEDPPQA